MPDDITVQYEKTQSELALTETKEKDITLPTFDQEELKTYTEQQIAEMRRKVTTLARGEDDATGPAQGMMTFTREAKDILEDKGLSLTRGPKIEYTPSGYVFEQHNIELQKVLGCSIAPKVKSNLIWDRRRGYITYTMQNILIFEELSVAKT